jgi:hypothetical protein
MMMMMLMMMMMMMMRRGTPDWARGGPNLDGGAEGGEDHHVALVDVVELLHTLVHWTITQDTSHHQSATLPSFQVVDATQHQSKRWRRVHHQRPRYGESEMMTVGSPDFP